MPIDLTALVDPKHTALVTQECQQGVTARSPHCPGSPRASRAST